MKSTSHVACVEVVWCYKLINSQLITLDRGERGTRYIQRYNNHSWAWRLIHRLSLPRLFLPKLTAALQKTVKHFYFKSAPVFPTESAVRGPSLRFFLFFFFFFGTHHPNDRMRRGSKKKKKKQEPGSVICDFFILPTSSYFRFVPFVVIWTEWASLVAIASNHSVCPKQLRAGRCYVGSCST